MPWYLYIALRHLFPQGKRFPVFTIMSITGVSLGVAVLIIVNSVFSGFGHELRTRIADTYGDLRVVNGSIIEDPDSLAKVLKTSELVERATPYAHGVIMLLYKNQPLYPLIEGIDVRSEAELDKLSGYLISGSIDDLDDDSLLLSSGFASQLGLTTGDEVDVYTPLMGLRLKQSQGDEVLLPRLLRIAGIYQTGWQRADENTVICTLRLMQDLYDLGEGSHGLRVELVDGADAEKEAIAITRSLGRPYFARTWMDSQAEFLSVLEFEKRMMFFLLFIIVIVAAFSIMSSLLIFVIRKTREIGLFSAMGATPREVSACFCLQGLFIGVSGTVAGFGLGFVLLGFRTQITKAISWTMGVSDSMKEIYAFSYLPVHVVPYDLVVISVLSIIVAVLAGLIPAYRAGKLEPVEALRSE